MYAAKTCPENESELKLRAAAIGCKQENLYVCVPNVNLTGLYEFCYKNPVATTYGELFLFKI